MQAKHADRPSFYTFVQLMRKHGMDTDTAKALWLAGCEI